MKRFQNNDAAGPRISPGNVKAKIRDTTRDLIRMSWSRRSSNIESLVDTTSTSMLSIPTDDLKDVFIIEPRNMVLRTDEDSGGKSPSWQREWQELKANEATENIHKKPLAEITSWLKEDTKLNKECTLVRILRGAAGSGKSVLLAHLAQSTDHKIAIASYFFSADAQGSKMRAAIFSIAGQLKEIEGLKCFDAALTCSHTVLRLKDAPLGEVFQTLLSEPAIEIAPTVARPVLVIFDGVHHCSSYEQSALRDFLKTVTPSTSNKLRFLVSVRDIGGLKIKSNPETTLNLDGDEKAEFLHSNLKDVLEEPEWKTVENLVDQKPGNRIVVKSLHTVLDVNLFVSVLQRLVELEVNSEGGDLARKIRKILKTKAALREQVTKDVMETLKSKLGEKKLKQLWACMYAAQEPLSISVLAEILRVQKSTLENCLQEASPLLFVGSAGHVFQEKQYQHNLEKCLSESSRFLHEVGHERLAIWALCHPSESYALFHGVYHLRITANRKVALTEESLTDLDDHFSRRENPDFRDQNLEDEDRNDAGYVARMALRELILDLSWLLDASEVEQDAVALAQLVRDAEYLSHQKALSEELSEELREELSDAVVGLSRSLEAVARDPKQLAAQLVGRLPKSHRLYEQLQQQQPPVQIFLLAPTLERIPMIQPMDETASRQSVASDTRSAASNVTNDNPNTAEEVQVEAEDDGITIESRHDELRATVNPDFTISVSQGDLEVCRLRGHTSKITAIVVLPELHTLISASQDRSVRFWNLETGQIRGDALPLHRYYVRALAANDHIAVSCGDADEAKVWRFDKDGATKAGELKPFEGWNFSAEALRGKSYGMAGRATSVVMDDRIIAVGHAYGIVCLYRCDTFAQVGVLGAFNISPAGTSEIVAMALSKEEILVTGAKGGQVRVWSIGDVLMQTQPPPMAYQRSGMGHRESEASFRGIGGSDRHVGSNLASIVLENDVPRTLIVRDSANIEHEHSLAAILAQSRERSSRNNANEPSPPTSLAPTEPSPPTSLAPTELSPPTSLAPTEPSPPTSLALTVEDPSEPDASVIYGSHREWGDIVAVSGSLAATAESDYSISVRRLTDGAEVCRLRGHTGRITAIVVLPELHTLISASQDRSVRFWNLETGQIRGDALPLHRLYVRALAANDHIAVSCGDADEAIVWRFDKDGATKAGELKPFEGWNFSAEALRGKSYGMAGRATSVVMDDRIIAVGHAYGIVCLYRCDTFAQVGVLGAFNPSPAGTSEIVAMALSEEGILVTGAKDGQVRVWSIEDALVQMQPPPMADQISGMGHREPEASFKGIGRSVGQGHNTLVALAFMPENPKHIIVASRDGFVTYWDWNRSTLISSKSHGTGKLSSLAVGEDVIIVGGCDRVAIILPVGAEEPSQEIQQQQGEPRLSRKTRRSRSSNARAHFSWLLGSHPEWGRLVVMNKDFVVCSGVDNSICVRGRADPEEDVHVLEGHTGTVSRLALHGSILASSSFRDGTIRIWDLRTGELTLKIQDDFTRNILVLAINEKHVAAARCDTVYMWSLRNGRREMLEATGESGSWVRALAMNDEILVVGYASGKVKVFSKSGLLENELEEHDQGVGAVVLHGHQIATGGEIDGRIKLWDYRAHNFEKLGEFVDPHPHGKRITSLAMDEHVLVEGSDDFMVSLWERSTETLIARCNVGVESVESVALADGLVVCAGNNKTVFAAPRDGFEGFCDSGRTSRRWNRVQVVYDLAAPFVRTQDESQGRPRPASEMASGRRRRPGWFKILRCCLNESRGETTTQSPDSILSRPRARSHTLVRLSTLMRGASSGTRAVHAASLDAKDSAFSRHSPDVASVDEVSSIFGTDSDHDEGKELDAAEDDAALAAEDAASPEDLASAATSTPNGSSSGAKLCGVHPDRGNLVVMNKSFLVSSGFSRSGSIRVYDRKTGDECFVLGNDGAPISLMVLHGDKLASWSFKEKCIRVWSLKAQTQKLCITKNAKNLVALAMNSKLLAGAKGAVVLVWSLSDGKKRFELQPPNARKDCSEPDIRALVMDCKIIVTGDTAGHVHVYSCANGKHLMYHDRHSHGVSALALRGRLVASAGECDHRIQVWDWKGEADDLGDFAVHSDRVSSLAFGHEVLVVGSDDYTVSTWDVIRSFLIARRNIKVGCVESIALEDGLLACAGSTGTTYVTMLQDFEHSNERRTSRRWSPIKLPAAPGIETSPHLILNHAPALGSKEVDDALRKISGLNTLALSDEIIAVAEKDALRIHDSICPRLASVQVPCGKEVTAVILGETDEILGTFCVIGCVDGSIGLLHLQMLDPTKISEPSFISEDGHKHRVTCINESRDYIVSGDASGTLCVWDKDSLSLEDCYISNEGPISAVVISPCGVHVYSADVNGRIFYWNRYGGDNGEFVNVAGIPLVLALDKKSLVARVSRASGEDAATSRAGKVYVWSRKEVSCSKRSSGRTAVSRGWSLQDAPKVSGRTLTVKMGSGEPVSLTFDAPLHAADAYVSRINDNDFVAVRDDRGQTHIMHLGSTEET